MNICGKIVCYVHRMNYVVYFMWHYLFLRRFRKLRKLKIANNVETVRYIIENRVSVSRFGDGEIAVIMGCDTDFQIANQVISCKLREILTSDNHNCIICLPYAWKRLFSFKYQAFEYWSSYLNKNLDSLILPAVDFNKKYFDSTFTRFYIDYRTGKNAKRIVPLIKKIWENQDVCIIEGRYSRLGVGNDLFDNSLSVSRIICPETNAFDVYDGIINQAESLPKSTLVLIALGMTATCLAYDLSQLGYWAIDIGHVDVEYEWFKMKAKTKVPIPNKYVAEATKQLIDDKVDSLYQSQIIAKILK